MTATNDSGRAGDGPARSAARAYVRPVAKVLLVAAVIGAVLIWLRPPELEAGQQVRGSAVSIHNGGKSNVALPGGGILRIEAGTVSEVRDGGSTFTADVGRLVGVTWRVDASPVGPAPWPGAAAAELREPATRLLLRVGDRVFPVADGIRSLQSNGSVTTRVPATGEIAVIAEAEGRELPGRSAEPQSGLDRRSEAPDCVPDGADPVTVDGVRLDQVACELRTRRGPWVAGLGWAPQGQEWLVVRGLVRTDHTVGSWDETEGSPTYYRLAAAPALRLSVSGATPQRAARDAAGQAAGESATPSTAYLVPVSSDVEVALSVASRAVKTDLVGPAAAAAPEGVEVALRQIVRIPGG
ncbi:hypothetical protein [Barrientosiimonas humi]|nr:hypothetical protein [Barrientosiimonas humi]